MLRADSDCYNRCHRGGCSSVGRVPDCDSGCRGFEPHQPPQILVYNQAMSNIKKINLIFIIPIMINACSYNQYQLKNKINFEREISFKENQMNFDVLENIESYRPASCSDMSRNPFMTHRYKFTRDE